MTEREGISPEQLRVLAERVGLSLAPKELELLKPMFDHYATQVRLLREAELELGDPAVAFSASWEPQAEA